MIYLDYNATTPLCPEARAAMEPYLGEFFGNASSVHRAGREARAAIDSARDEFAQLLGVRPNELIFTSGGTEANNLAIIGLARRHVPNGKHLISNRAEHHAVLNALEHLQKREGFEVTWLDVLPNGLIAPNELAAATRSDTTLVSIMSANNETGVMQPLEQISAICRERGVLLHSDMVQSFGKSSGDPEAVIASEVEASCRVSSTVTPRDPSTALRSPRDDVSLVDAASFAAHKFYGPKGAGFLYLRAGLPIESIQFGGAHEGERRPGTENVAAIAGMATAARVALDSVPNESDLRHELWCGIAEIFPAAIGNGAQAPRLTNTLNVSFPGWDSETLLMALDLEGVCASSGSACMVGSVTASHVLQAMGLPNELTTSAIRFSLGKETTAEEIAQTVAALKRILQRRAIPEKKHAFA